MSTAVLPDLNPPTAPAESRKDISAIIDARTGPTPKQVDEIIAFYDAAYRSHKETEKKLTEAKELLLQTIRLFGHATPGSERSHQIAGALGKAVMTTGTVITVNDDRVHELLALLAKEEQMALFDQLFSQRTKWEMVGGAEDAIRKVSLPQRLAQKVLAAFAVTFTLKDKAPSLKVELLQKEPKAKKPRARKAVQG